MPTICFVGDLHGQLTQAYAALMAWMERTGKKIDAVVQVGDLGVYGTGTAWSSLWRYGTPAPIPTWVCMGNHEDPLFVAQWAKNPDRIPDMHLMADGEITSVFGVQIGVVWGNYSPISWLDPSRVHHARLVGGESERIAMHIDKDAVDRLLATYARCGDHMDVLVTHESAASTLPVQFRGKGIDNAIKGILGLRANEEVGGCPGFSQLLKAYQPDEYFFGHLHCFDEGMLGRTHYTCLNAIGYPGGPWFKVLEFDKDFGIPVEMRDYGTFNNLGGGQ
jgi:hypothetical protein